jgi:hypothetical protein
VADLAVFVEEREQLLWMERKIYMYCLKVRVERREVSIYPSLHMTI